MKTYIWNTEFEVIIVNAESEDFARSLALSKYQLQVTDAVTITRWREDNPNLVEVIYADRIGKIDWNNDYTYGKIARQLKEPPHFVLDSNSALIYTHSNE